MKNFDIEALLATATERTGLTDLGSPDCLDALEALVVSINANGEIAPDRWDAVFEYIVRLLVDRLLFTRDLAQHPEILEEDLLPPVAIVGLPRTGSTKLQRMLGAADNFQHLLWWQMHRFARIPGVENNGAAQRFQETKNYEEWVYQQCPDMEKGHPRYAEAPEEEQILQESTFPPVLAVPFSGADYSQDRLAAFDPQPMYDYMGKQLKYLQWQFYPEQKRPWVLKSPTNLGFEAQMVNTFGRNTRFICPHRNPVNVVCSIAKTAEYYRRVFSDVLTDEKRQSLASNMINALTFGMQRQIAWRQENPDVQILDVSFKDVNHNPVEVLESIYQFLGLELSDNIVATVKKWDEEQKTSHQRNEYSLEYFGLTERQVYDAFEPYLDQFGNYIKN